MRKVFWCTLLSLIVQKETKQELGEMSAPVVIAASAKHTATLIFLHGLGDTGQGWASAMATIRPPHVKVICPTAPTIPVTLNNGFRMPSWFDLRTLDVGGPEDVEGIKSARDYIHTMIEDECRTANLSPSQIIVGGFSQGGALALYSALTYPQKLAGVISLSGWLPLHKTFPSDMRCPPELEVLQCHGDCDPVVPYKWGQMSASFLKNLVKNDFKTYRGLMHTSSDEEMGDMAKFISERLKN